MLENARKAIVRASKVRSYPRDRGKSWNYTIVYLTSAQAHEGGEAKNVRNPCVVINCFVEYNVAAEQIVQTLSNCYHQRQCLSSMAGVDAQGSAERLKARRLPRRLICYNSFMILNRAQGDQRVSAGGARWHRSWLWELREKNRVEDVGRCYTFPGRYRQPREMSYR